MKDFSITDSASQLVNKLNANFNITKYTDAECRNRFILEMNQKAALLGMTNTNFVEPAGNQPADYNNPQLYTELYLVYGRNTMSVRDAMRMMLYASGIRSITDAWNIQQFTLNYKNGSETKSATIKSTVFNNTTAQSSVNALLEDYEILGGKTGSVSAKSTTVDGQALSWKGALNLVTVVRSYESSKVYAVCYINVNGSNTASNNRWNDVKAALDYIEGKGTAPSLPSGGNMMIAEFPQVPVLLLNRTNTFEVLFENGDIDVAAHPASVSKLMTAIVLSDCLEDLNQFVTIHESDRQPPTGTAFVAGDVIQLKDMVKCLLTESSNTCAVAISRIVGRYLLNKDNNVFS